MGHLLQVATWALVPAGEGWLPGEFRAYEAQHNEERPHQGIGNRTVVGPAKPRSTSLRLVIGHERLGGLLRHCRASA